MPFVFAVLLVSTLGAAAQENVHKDRAAAVKACLVRTSGVAAARLTTAGRCDTQPVGDNGSDAGRTPNRRVELVKT